MLSKSQSKILEHFKTSVINEKLNQTYVIYGDSGYGKKYICNEILKTVMCENKTGCGKCKGCMTVISKANPNITEISNEEKKIIDIDKIRFLKSRVYMKPINSTYSFFVIKNAELMTASAQNALLKIIEEPPRYAVFILLCNNIKYLLPTVISRSFKFELMPFSEDEMKKIYPLENDKEFMYSYSMGSMDILKKINGNELFSGLRDGVIRGFIKLFEKDDYCIYESIDFWNENREQKDELCKILMMFLRDVVLYKNDMKKLIINKDKISEIKYTAERCDLKKCVNLLEYAGNIEKRFGIYDDKIAVTVQTVFMQLKEEIDDRCIRSKI